MKKEAPKRKRKRIGKFIEYGFVVLFIGLLFTTDLKAEVFGFIQRGLLKIGLFTPEVEIDAKHGEAQKNTAEPYHHRNLILEDQNGESLHLNDLKGKVVFINFWATWCPPCIAEMPGINKLYQDYAQDDEVVFLMISQDQEFAKAKAFLKRKDFDFDIYTPRSTIPKALQSSGIPNTLVLAKDGDIEFKHVGLGNYNTETFKKFINHLKSM